MSILRKALLTAAFGIMISFSAYAGASGHITAFSSPSDLTLYPESIAATGYQTAGLKFLPEMQDSEVSWSGREFPDDHNQGNNCGGYELTTCPAHGSCSSCPFDRKYKKLTSCASGYTKSGNSCSAGSCQSIGYRTDIPTNNTCTKVTEGSLTCYKDCKSVSCSGYTLNCDTFNVANSSGKTMCPDCNNANASCSPKLCKVSGCMDGFKIAGNGTECGALDDTCPANYFKSCETATQGNPQYTEKGTACYQCKPKAAENICPILTPAQKCAEEGYKTMNEWNQEKPDGGLIMLPGNTTTVPELSLTSAELTKPSKINYWFKEILGIKTASATSMMTICDDCRLNGCKSSICATSCPEACSATVKPLLNYVFDKTATCPYDSSYVKGVWTKVDTETELPTPMGCSSNQVRLICNGVTWCCGSHSTTCSNLSSAVDCYSKACMTQDCEGYNDNIAKTGKGWTSESCMPVAGNCIKGPAKYKNTCKTSILYTLSTCPANARCEGDCSNKYKVIGCDCGYTLQNGTCVADGSGTTPEEPKDCTSSLTFRTSSGSIYTAKPIDYNGVKYAVVNYGNGISCATGKTRCEEGGYSHPDYNFVKYMFNNKATLGFTPPTPTCSSTQCGSTQYLNCSSATSCSCQEYTSVFTGINLCVKKLCSDFTADSCPAGYQLNSCNTTEKQIETTSSTQGGTCYKCASDTCPSNQFKTCGSNTIKTNGSTTAAGTQCYKCPCIENYYQGVNNPNSCIACIPQCDLATARWGKWYAPQPSAENVVFHAGGTGDTTAPCNNIGLSTLNRPGICGGDNVCFICGRR